MIVRVDYSDKLAEQVFILAFHGEKNSLLSRMGVDSVEVMKAILQHANYIFLLECGIAWMEGTTRQKTEIHFVFWSKDIFRLLPEMKETLELFSEKTGIQRISTMIPQGNKVLEKMVKEMGFDFEGTMKKIWKTSDGEVLSADVYAKVY